MYLRFAINEGNLKFERVYKQVVNAHNNLWVLEEHIVVCRQHENVILDLVMKCVRGAGF